MNEYDDFDDYDYNPEPAGAWEAGMLHDVFGGDPNCMTDDEYEMIFGHSR